MDKAIITEAGKPLQVLHAELPEVPPEGALIKTLYAGVCHSDLHFIHDEMDLGSGKVFRNRDILGDRFHGLTLGHEISGLVEKLGPEAEQTLSVGDRVCVYPWIGCQKCMNCSVGRNNMCYHGEGGTLDIGQGEYGGGYGSYVVVPKVCFLLKVPDSIPMQVACMLPCSAGTTYASLQKARPSIESAIESRNLANVLLIGAGGLGLWCTQLAKKAMFLGEKVKIAIADISKEKRKLALEAGADEFVLWNKGMDRNEMLEAVSDGGKREFDAVINFVGSANTTEVGLKALMHGGIQVVIGLYGGETAVSLPLIVGKSLGLVGSRTCSIDELKETIEMVREADISFPKLNYFPLREINVAIQKLEKGEMEGRGIIQYQ